MPQQNKPENALTARDRILAVTLTLVRERGYAATSVDAICEAASITKGAFFHHFKSKEDLAIAAAGHWSQVTGTLFEGAPYHKIKDPYKKLLAYVKLRKELLKGSLPEITCFVGTMVQETYSEHPKIRAACYESIFGHAETYQTYIAEAKAKYAPSARWSVRSLALHIQGTIQGAFVLAKASNNVEVAAACIDHLENYLKLLFGRQR